VLRILSSTSDAPKKKIKKKRHKICPSDNFSTEQYT
jgi:hypothetical protein